MDKRKSNKSLRRKSEPFKPTRMFINGAVADYLNRGGKITQLASNRSYYYATHNDNHYFEADDFLIENTILQ
ncbi:hypothetical protein KJ966_25945 [bacterium]|nr:hypothetical protein [bacterium]